MKLYRLLLYIIFCSQVAFSTPAQDLEEEISLYSPSGRFGFTGSIVKITLENVQDGPKDNHLSLKNSPTNPSFVPKNHLVFDEETQYVSKESGNRGNLQGSISRELSSIIKYRISTYAIARLTLDSYLNCGADPTLFNALNVVLNPNDEACSLGIGNAYYQRTSSHGTGNIELCSAVNNQAPLPTARFFDIVSHETGHSILDTLRAHFYGHQSTSPLAAFHEAFGDLSTFFASVRLARVLGHHDQVVTLLSNPGINLCLAYNMDGRGHCLRNSRDVSASCESHDNSRTFTNFYLKSMGEFFSKCPQSATNAYWVVDNFQRVLVESALNIKTLDSLYDIGAQAVAETLRLKSIHTNDILTISTTLMNQLMQSKESLQSCVVLQPETTRLPDLRGLKLTPA